MFPDYIRKEVVRRLSSFQAARLAKSLGINVTRARSALSPQPLQELGDLPYRGSMDFSLIVSALGDAHVLPARLHFACDLADGIDHLTGKPARVPETINSNCCALLWQRGEPAPHWQDFDDILLPQGAIEQLLDQAGALAVAQEHDIHKKNNS